MRIGIWAFFGLGNLGDDEIQTAVIQNITSRVPETDVIAICLDPEQVSSDFGVSAYPIFTGPVFHPQSSMAVDDSVSSPSDSSRTFNRDRPSSIKRITARLKKVPILSAGIQTVWRVREKIRYLREIYHCVGSLDLLLISGSGVLDDTWKGRWRRPFALYKWCVIARLTRTPLAFISVGATSINTKLGRYFGGKALALATFRSYRDRESADVARSLMASSEASDPVVPDLAFSLETPRTSIVSSGTGQRIVGIGPIPFGDPRIWPQKDPDVYEAYVSKLAEFVNWLIESGYRIRFILGHKIVDRMTVQDIVDHVRAGGSSSEDTLQQPQIEAVDQLLEAISSVDYVVSSRFHGVLLPYLLAKPVVALSYNSKIHNLMASVGQDENCLDIESFTVTDCRSAFDNICKNQDEIRARLIRSREVNRTILDNQYDSVLTLAR